MKGIRTWREIELRECLVEFSEIARVEWGDMKMRFSYSVIKLYVFSILMSLHNKIDRERDEVVDGDR
jgi:hypothetical protein